MRTARLLLFSTLTLAACGPLAEEEAVLGEQSQAVTTDADADGIDDALEDSLAAKFAPEVRLAPDSIDWTRPANVDWYLARVHLRFDHSGCPDCQVLALGTPTQANLSTQTHNGKSGLLYSHDSTVYKSSDSHKEFFLQPEDDAVHNGTTSPGWRVYVHTKRSTLVSGGSSPPPRRATSSPRGTRSIAAGCATARRSSSGMATTPWCTRRMARTRATPPRATGPSRSTRRITPTRAVRCGRRGTTG